VEKRIKYIKQNKHGKIRALRRGQQQKKGGKQNPNEAIAIGEFSSYQIKRRGMLKPKKGFTFRGGWGNGEKRGDKSLLGTFIGSWLVVPAGLGRRRGEGAWGKSGEIISTDGGTFQMEPAGTREAMSGWSRKRGLQTAFEGVERRACRNSIAEEVEGESPCGGLCCARSDVFT